MSIEATRSHGGAKSKRVRPIPDEAIQVRQQNRERLAAHKRGLRARSDIMAHGPFAGIRKPKRSMANSIPVDIAGSGEAKNFAADGQDRASHHQKDAIPEDKGKHVSRRNALCRYGEQTCRLRARARNGHDAFLFKVEWEEMKQEGPDKQALFTVRLVGIARFLRVFLIYQIVQLLARDAGLPCL